MMKIALLAIALTGASPEARADNAPTGSWVVLAGDQSGPGQFHGPNGVAVNQQGTVHVVELRNRRVQKLGQPDDA